MKNILLSLILTSTACFGQTLCDLNITDRNTVADFWNKGYQTTLNEKDTDSLDMVLSNDKTYVVCEFGEDDSTLWVMTIYTSDKAVIKMVNSMVKKGESVILYDNQKALVLNCPKDVFLLKQKATNGYKTVWTVFYAKEPEPDSYYYDE